MKTKILNSLKSRFLLVDGLPINGEIDMDFLHETLLPKGKWNLLCKLKDLTDKDCEGLVNNLNNNLTIQGDWYENYLDDESMFMLTKESFLSALEADGLHLNENPFGKTCPIVDEPDPSSQYYGCQKDNLKDWQEAEQNVFSENTLVFVEQ